MRDGKNTARDLFRGKTKLYLPELFSMFHFLSFEMGHVMLSKKIKGVFGCIYTTEKCGKGQNLVQFRQIWKRNIGVSTGPWVPMVLTGSDHVFLLCKHTFHHLGNKVSQTPACNVSISHCTVVMPHTSASTAYVSVGGRD